MDNIIVKLLNRTPLWITANAIRMSHDTKDNSDTYMITKDINKCTSKEGDVNLHLLENDKYIMDQRQVNIVPVQDHIGLKDFQLIKRVGCKLKHESVLEFIDMHWEIDGISRGCLQELARHRLSSLTVKSSRYTLQKDLKNEEPFCSEEIEKDQDSSEVILKEYSESRAKKFIVFTNDGLVDNNSIEQLENLRQIVQTGKSNDVIKYNVPECFRTKLQIKMNMRTFLNFYKLRTDKSAHFEISQLANLMYETLDFELQEIVDEYFKKR